MSATTQGRPCPIHPGETLILCQAQHLDGHLYEHCTTPFVLHNVDVTAALEEAAAPSPRRAMFPLELDRLGDLEGPGVRIAQAIRESA